jgi:hypothetical protein
LRNIGTESHGFGIRVAAVGFCPAAGHERSPRLQQMPRDRLHSQQIPLILRPFLHRRSSRTFKINRSSHADCSGLSWASDSGRCRAEGRAPASSRRCDSADYSALITMS